MTVKEFSKKVGKSENAIRRKLERGTLEGVKKDGVWDIQVDEYIDRRYRRFSIYDGKGIIRIDSM